MTWNIILLLFNYYSTTGYRSKHSIISTNADTTVVMTDINPAYGEVTHSNRNTASNVAANTGTTVVYDTVQIP